MNDFFQDANYEIPVTSNYMKFSEGDNTFRVLSSAIIGYEYFDQDNKPVRSPEPFDVVPTDVKKGGAIKHFWAFAVYNYEAKRIQVMELTQKGLMKAIQAYVKNPKWGNPKGYDITVTRTGSGLDTEYSITPNPHSPLDAKIASQYANMNVNLNALYENGDPFVKTE